jgi:hypothetical protein
VGFIAPSERRRFETPKSLAIGIVIKGPQKDFFVYGFEKGQQAKITLLKCGECFPNVPLSGEGVEEAIK